MIVFVVNCGSSSIKYQLINMEGERVMAKGLIERIGMEGSTLKHTPAGKYTIDLKEEIPDHKVGIRLAIKALTSKEYGVIKDMSEIDAVGHRVVHGGERFTDSVLITSDVLRGIEACCEIAPLHNPPNLYGINACMEIMRGTPQVAVFDTAFHQTMPKVAYLYGLPYEMYVKYGVRRYGFHGTSHKYIARKTAEYLGKPLNELRSITMHLGNGSSMSCVKDGKCFDTSMGLTPLEGLIMGTRCGSIDPAIVPFVMEKKSLSPAEADTLMNKKSGLLGLCGYTDMRDVHSQVEKGNERAALALQMLVRSIKKTLGSYFFLLDGKVDALVFTAGIGENDDIVRAAVCDGLEGFGIKLDLKENAIRKPGARAISLPDSKIPVLIIPTNEELAIARDTLELTRK